MCLKGGESCARGGGQSDSGSRATSNGQFSNARPGAAQVTPPPGDGDDARAPALPRDRRRRAAGGPAVVAPGAVPAVLRLRVPRLRVRLGLPGLCGGVPVPAPDRAPPAPPVFSPGPKSPHSFRRSSSSPSFIPPQCAPPPQAPSSVWGFERFIPLTENNEWVFFGWIEWCMDGQPSPRPRGRLDGWALATVSLVWLHRARPPSPSAVAGVALGPALLTSGAIGHVALCDGSWPRALRCETGVARFSASMCLLAAFSICRCTLRALREAAPCVPLLFRAEGKVVSG